MLPVAVVRTFPFLPTLQATEYGWIVKTLPDGRCIQIHEKMFNDRVSIGPQPPADILGGYEHGYCYFGLGSRSFVNAVLAAYLGDGGPAGPTAYDKQAF
jgi:hypothetical protein